MSWADLQKKMAKAKTEPTTEKKVEATPVVETTLEIDEIDIDDLRRFRKPRTPIKTELTPDSDWGFDFESVPEDQEEEDIRMRSEPPISYDEPPAPNPYDLPEDEIFEEEEVEEEVEAVEEEIAEEPVTMAEPDTVAEETVPRPPTNPEYTESVEERLLTLLEACLFQVVDDPADFELEVVRSANVIILTVLARDRAMGKLLGKGGRYANAIRGASQSWWGKYKMRAEYSVNLLRE